MIDSWTRVFYLTQPSGFNKRSRGEQERRRGRVSNKTHEAGLEKVPRAASIVATRWIVARRATIVGIVEPKHHIGGEINALRQGVQDTPRNEKFPASTTRHRVAFRPCRHAVFIHVKEKGHLPQTTDFQEPRYRVVEGLVILELVFEFGLMVMALMIAKKAGLRELDVALR
jgi:hypothetical protein